MTLSSTEFNDLMDRVSNGTASEEETGALILGIEQWEGNLFGIKLSGKHLINRNNPHVMRCIHKAERMN